MEKEREGAFSCCCMDLASDFFLSRTEKKKGKTGALLFPIEGEEKREGSVVA